MLARNYRFHGHGSLSFLFRRGKTVRGNFLVLRCIANERRSYSRIAVVVSKKISKSAVVRNRIRRRVFEVIRLQLPHMHGVHDLAFIVLRDDLATLSAAEVTHEIESILNRANLHR